MATLELNGKSLATQTSTAEPVIASTVTGAPALALTNATGTMPTGTQDNITRLGTVTSGNLSNTAIVFPTGSVKKIYTQNIGGGAGSTVMYKDNTTPLVSEGVQVGSIASVVVGSGDIVVCNMCVHLDDYGGSPMVMAFFQDSTCVGSSFSDEMQTPMTHITYDAPSAGTYTYSWRTGRTTAGTFWYNGSSAGPLFNGTLTSVFTVTVIEG